MAIEITSFKPVNKGSLQGFVTIRMTQAGLELKDCMILEKAGRRWVGLPSIKYTKADGKVGYQPVVSFYDRSMESKFRDAILAAIDAFAKLEIEGEPPF